MDLLCWASDGRMPFLRLHTISERLLQAARETEAALPDALLQPSGESQGQTLSSFLSCSHR